MHHDGTAADRRAGQLATRHLQGQFDLARAAHLVALLDADVVLAVRIAAVLRQISRKGRRSRSGRGVFGHALQRREHARVEVMAAFDSLAAEHVSRRVRVESKGCFQCPVSTRQRLIASSPRTGTIVYGAPADQRAAFSPSKPMSSAPMPSAAAMVASSAGAPTLLRQPRKLEHGAPVVRRGCHAARHRADVELEDEVARLRAAVEQAEQDRGADGRMARERQFRHRRENAQFSRGARCSPAAARIPSRTD